MLLITISSKKEIQFIGVGSHSLRLLLVLNKTMIARILAKQKTGFKSQKPSIPKIFPMTSSILAKRKASSGTRSLNRISQRTLQEETMFDFANEISNERHHPTAN